VHQHQPQLFKTHQAKLSTASQGIKSVPSQTHTLLQSASRKLSPLRRFFQRKEKLGSDTSGSRLSIDYAHFSIADATRPSRQGQKFTDAHVNPGVSFNNEGMLAQTEEVQIDVPVHSVEHELTRATREGLDRMPEPDLPMSESGATELLDNELYQSSSTLTSHHRTADVERDLPVTCIDDLTESVSDIDIYEKVQHQREIIEDFAA